MIGLPPKDLPPSPTTWRLSFNTGILERHNIQIIIFTILNFSFLIYRMETLTHTYLSEIVKQCQENAHHKDWSTGSQKLVAITIIRNPGAYVVYWGIPRACAVS